jgi:hypothetical protein
MKIKKNIMLGIGVFLITMLLILSSGVSMANTTDIDYQVSVDYKDEITLCSSLKRIICYGSNLHKDPHDNLVSFYSDDPGTLTHVADSSSDNYLEGGCFVGDEWWACEFSDADNSNIWVIDETVGAMYLIGEAGVSLTGLAYDNDTDTLYGCSSIELFTINQANGDASSIGPFNTGGLMVGIACDLNGKMYGEDSVTDSLYEINTATGTATLIGELGIDLNDAQDIAYDKDNKILYSTGYKGSTAGGGALGTLDQTDGHYTSIGDFPTGSEGCPSQVACFAIPYNIPNDPPDIPIIDGPLVGHTHKEICWSFKSTDPNGDQVKYHIKWDDGDTNETDFHPSGEWVEACHTYTPLIRQGKYEIIVWAEDEKGLEGEKEILGISIPRYKSVYNSLFLRLFELLPNTFLILRALLEM